MSEALISEAVQSPAEQLQYDDHLLTARRPTGDLRSTSAVSCRLVSCLPGVREGEPAAPPRALPGQLWLIEMSTGNNARSALEIAALTTVNVLIYDRALASIVAEYLPLGGYAEPVSTSDGQPDRTLARCLQFARDGWSVAWLMEPESLLAKPAAGVRGLWEGLTVATAVAGCAVLLADADGQACRKIVASPGALAGLVSGHRLAARIGIIVDADGAGPVPGISVASSNGLAG